MNLLKRKKAFVQLGKFLTQFSILEYSKSNKVLLNDLFYDDFKKTLDLAEQHNGWFTKNNIVFAIKLWSNLLTDSNITKWISKYNFNLVKPKIVAVIMAGNIPLVGFHDFLSVLLSGHRLIVKQSSNDKYLFPLICKYLETIEPLFKNTITFVEDKLQQFDAVIATGSNNTSRYFEYYFKDKPNIIRKNRNSIAVLTENESEQDLNQLSEDIFRYFGLGCRNISKLYVPLGYNFDAFFNSIYQWKNLINITKYANNYDYNKAIYLMSSFQILDNGFFMLKEDDSMSSPIGSLNYEYYASIDELKAKLIAKKEYIQCIASSGFIDNETPFGLTQKPQLWDYADHIDTVHFLLKI